MPITIDGNGTISGISAGGLPDSSVTSADIADAAVTPTKLSQPLTLATVQTPTSGTNIDFAGIPSWVKRITLMLDGISTTGANFPVIRIGDSGGLENTGYFCQNAVITGANTCSMNTATGGWQLPSGNATNTIAGAFIVTNLSGNTWVISGTGTANTGNVFYLAGSKTLSDKLTQISVITVDAFDAGSINIMYE